MMADFRKGSMDHPDTSAFLEDVPRPASGVGVSITASFVSEKAPKHQITSPLGLQVPP